MTDTRTSDDSANICPFVTIKAAGMLTPIGENASMTAASVRSDISAYHASEILNKNLQPMTMALVPEDALPPISDALAEEPLTSRQQRLLRLCTPALKQIEEFIDRPLPLLLCGPEKIPGRRSVISDKTLEQLVIQSGIEFDLENSYVFPQGRAAGFYALESAMVMLANGQFEQIIIGGADSFLDLHLLASLDVEDRVLAEGVMDGFAPGEAAAFLVIERAGEESTTRMTSPGISEEPGHRHSHQPYKGEGLAGAVSSCFTSSPDSRVKSVFASFNGENFNAKEWSVAAIRNQNNLDPDFNIVHPADCYGDIGAATVPVLISLAHLGLSNGNYDKPALIWASSEYEHRAAGLLL